MVTMVDLILASGVVETNVAGRGWSMDAASNALPVPL